MYRETDASSQKRNPPSIRAQSPTTARLEVEPAHEEGATNGVQLERDKDDLKKLQEMNELQLAILTELMPVSPCAIHSEVLLDTLAPFLKAQRKKDRRREFEAAVTPLVQARIRYDTSAVSSTATPLIQSA